MIALLRARIALVVAVGCCFGLLLAPGGAAESARSSFPAACRARRGRIRPTSPAGRCGSASPSVPIAPSTSRSGSSSAAAGGPSAGFVLRGAEPGRHHLLWAGRTESGAEAPDGGYLVLVGRRGHNLKRAAGFAFHGHVFPVRGPHGVRGAIGRFGAPRSGGRTHEGFDVVAACGTPLDAARGGGCCRRGFDPVLYGNYVLIHGRGEHRSYFYAHLRRPSPARPRRAGPHRRSGSGRWARPATRSRSAATCTSRSASAAGRSTRSPRCAAGIGSADLASPGGPWPEPAQAPSS